jgi:hypothetical protein
MTETPPSPKRRRGAPRGNTNALKHGFYSPRYGPNTPGATLTAQISVLRAYIAHVFQLSQDLHSVKNQVSLLKALTHSVASLNHLVLLQQRIPGSAEQKDQARAVLLQAVTSIYPDLPPAPADSAENKPAPGRPDPSEPYQPNPSS